MSIRSINNGALFGGRCEETREDANEKQIHIINLPHTNLYVTTHMYQFVASLFYSTLFCCGGKANLVQFTLFYSTLLALTDRQMDRWTDGDFVQEIETLGVFFVRQHYLLKFELCHQKKDTVVCLAGARSLLRPKKKRYSRLSGGCAIIITTGKKKDTVVCLAGA